MPRIQKQHSFFSWHPSWTEEDKGVALAAAFAIAILLIVVNSSLVGYGADLYPKINLESDFYLTIVLTLLIPSWGFAQLSICLIFGFIFIPKTKPIHRGLAWGVIFGSVLFGVCYYVWLFLHLFQVA